MSLANSTYNIIQEGRTSSVSVKLNKTNNSLDVSWVSPQVPSLYDGAIILLSEEKFSSEEFPEDGKKYSMSSVYGQNNSDTKIGKAQVIYAYYNYFGDSMSVRTVNVTGINPNKIYYASIHICTNVLQYHTDGRQSYALDVTTNPDTKGSYAGSLAESFTPPDNPYNGQSYFDPVANIVYVYDGSNESWVKSNQKTFGSGGSFPVFNKKIIYNRTNSKLYYFNKTQWVEVSDLNCKIKAGSGWIPFAGVNTASKISDVSNTPGTFCFINNIGVGAFYSSPEMKVNILGAWLSASSDLIKVEIDGVFENAIVPETIYVSSIPEIPSIGDFFYLTTTNDLYAWFEGEWVKADTEQQGKPTTDKTGLGTNGSYAERTNLMKILKHQLGWPNTCVELSEEQFNIAVDNALDEFRRRADNAYKRAFLPIIFKQGQSVYYLNDPRTGTDKVVEVLECFRVNHFTLNNFAGDNWMYAQAMVNQLFANPGQIDFTTIHLMYQQTELYQRLFSGSISYVWDEASRQLLLKRQIVSQNEHVLLEVAVEKTEQELLLDRYAKQWLQGWAFTECLEMLGMSRSKYTSLPGGVSLNGAELLGMVEAQQNELLRQIHEKEVGNGSTFGNTSIFIG